MADTEQRALFKSWWDRTRPLESGSFHYEVAWRAWQAALASQAQVPDGWVLSREGDDIRITADGVASFLVRRTLFRGDFDEFVWLFLDAMLAAAPAQEGR
ncbi:hypothetical protein [Xanthomonas sp. NCPPB 1128]|uniref:hypothetical protein n=1 Tax=Xanthomonas sp. NCPPB 1128 TaxID=1775876 RepID=UPI00065AC428|nr:hypothetical protein [Xanthomonas sp. NCPPB 1128]